MTSQARKGAAERKERWAICQSYIKRTATLPEAQKLAASEGVRFNTSVWITAMSKLLERRREEHPNAES